MTKPRVAYFTDIQHRQDVGGKYSIKETKSDVGSFSFSRGVDVVVDVEKKCLEDHPMDPQRLRMVHSLVLSLGLRDEFQLVHSRPCSAADLQVYHSKEYLEFLSQVTHRKILNGEISADATHVFNVGPVADDVDCTAFEGIWDFNKLVAGASLDAAHMLRTGQTDIAINWSGGLHHAKSQNAAGFCYVNDCVLAIIELLHTFDRVLYIDIDFHHGDGVEEAFYITDRVCTLSLHRFGPRRVFPGTGDVVDTGEGLGRYHSINVPLLGGIGDETYVDLFEEILHAVVKKFKPDCVVLQSGADSLVGDSVGLENGCFNLSTQGHGDCVRLVRDLKLPLLVLGGGGYAKTSVAKCWAIETAILCGAAGTLPASLPQSDHYYDEYKDKSLHVKGRKDAVDFNSPGRIQQIRDMVLSNIEKIQRYRKKTTRSESS